MLTEGDFSKIFTLYTNLLYDLRHSINLIKCNMLHDQRIRFLLCHVFLFKLLFFSLSAICLKVDIFDLSGTLTMQNTMIQS